MDLAAFPRKLEQNIFVACWNVSKENDNRLGRTTSDNEKGQRRIFLDGEDGWIVYEGRLLTRLRIF